MSSAAAHSAPRPVPRTTPAVGAPVLPCTRSRCGVQQPSVVFEQIQRHGRLVGASPRPGTRWALAVSPVGRKKVRPHCKLVQGGRRKSMESPSSAPTHTHMRTRLHATNRRVLDIRVFLERAVPCHRGTTAWRTWVADLRLSCTEPL